MIFKTDEIAAVLTGDKVVCAECADLDDIDEQDQIWTLSQVDEESLVFCDECGKRIR